MRLGKIQIILERLGKVSPVFQEQYSGQLFEFTNFHEVHEIIFPLNELLLEIYSVFK